MASLFRMLCFVHHHHQQLQTSDLKYNQGTFLKNTRTTPEQQPLSPPTNQLEASLTRTLVHHHQYHPKRQDFSVQPSSSPPKDNRPQKHNHVRLNKLHLPLPPHLPLSRPPNRRRHSRPGTISFGPQVFLPVLTQKEPPLRRIHHLNIQLLQPNQSPQGQIPLHFWIFFTVFRNQQKQEQEQQQEQVLLGRLEMISR